MAYCTQSDIEARITAAKVAELSKAEGAAAVVPGLIADADSEIDMHETDLWHAAAKTACSLALSIESLYRRKGTGKLPRDVSDMAKVWRDRLDLSGLRDSKAGSWSAIAFDPTLGETPAELDWLLTGQPSGYDHERRRCP